MGGDRSAGGRRKIKTFQFSALGENHAAIPEPIATPAFDKDTHAKWLWTDDNGRTQPQVTLFDGLFSAGNPHLKNSMRPHRAMALQVPRRRLHELPRAEQPGQDEAPRAPANAGTRRPRSSV